METYLVYCGNRIVGFVQAINGDIAWLLTQIANPQATHLKPTM